MTARHTAPPPKPMPARTRKATRAVGRPCDLRSEEEAAVALALAGVGAAFGGTRCDGAADGASALASAAGKTSIALTRRAMVAIAPCPLLVALLLPCNDEFAAAASAELP